MNSSPNILLICLDDFGWTDLSCQGSTFYETPVLDQLAASGIRMTDAYAAAPVCSPSRAAIMTGKTPARLNLTNYIPGHAKGKLIDTEYLYHLPDGEHTLPMALKDQGYQTWHVGKWHLGDSGHHPQDVGFDINIGGNHHGHPYRDYFAPWELENLPEGEPGEYLTDALTDHAIHTIENRDRESPFFLNLWYYSVHTPIQARPEVVEKYKAKAKAMGLDQHEALSIDEHFPCEHKRDQHITRRLIQSDPTYAAMIEIVDTNIGRVLDTLQEQGELENTLIIFTSDNGGLSSAEGSPTCNAPLREGKGWIYDGGERVPLFFSWPGIIPADQTSDAPCYGADLYPTIMNLAGFSPALEQCLDGHDLSPVLTGQSASTKHDLYFHYPHYSNQGGRPSGAIRRGSWKLIEDYETQQCLLFNIKEDISEENECSASHPELVEELHRALSAWRQETGALMPTPNPDWVE